MAKYEISDPVVKNIMAIVNASTIKGSEAIAIIEIMQALSKPIKENEEIK